MAPDPKQPLLIQPTGKMALIEASHPLPKLSDWQIDADYIEGRKPPVRIVYLLPAEKVPEAMRKGGRVFHDE